jgi:Protein of unknown function (DUF2971)
MTTTTIPPALYKYLAPERASRVLGELRIRFSQVSVLNDADEFQPPYKGVATRAEIEKNVRERFKLKHPEQYAEAYRKLPSGKADQLINEMVVEWADTVEANYEKSVQKVYDVLDRNFGILSLSETVTSKLMWSFYSDGGRGVAVEFDPSHPWFNAKTTDSDSFRHLRQVGYVEDRKPDYLLTTRDDDVLYTKTLEWDFEKEWRIIRNFNDAVDKVGADVYDKEVLLFDLPPSAIKSIVLGYKGTPQLEKDLRGMVTRNPNLSHVIFRQAVREANGHIEIKLALPIAL